MTADVIGAGEAGAGGTGRGGGPDTGEPRDAAARHTVPGHIIPEDMTRGGIAASAVLHVVVLVLVLFGLPNLFRKPPPRDMPIAVRLVTIAPETRATTPNPFRP